ncbi:MAG: Flp family type IVb pilin [Proteobacteria bacterium]|nr:Flp family type IVb pilin [Pseudomonadota bacterium]
MTNAIVRQLQALHRDERGQGMTEYVIILVAIAVVCIAIAVQFGGKIKALFETADAEIDTVDSNM